MTHYEVVIYADDTHRDGNIVLITPDIVHASECADMYREKGYKDVDIRKFE